MILTSTRTLRQSILASARGASPIEHIRFGEALGGRLTVPVLPHTAHEKVLFHGLRADVWLKPGITNMWVVAFALLHREPVRRDEGGPVIPHRSRRRRLRTSSARPPSAEGR